ncbi:transcriptional regulator [candidate division MSBL1 archaeon SCGC-AAA259D18]|uniref:Transcriptional regulator n=1 Tax=candidate division MSBL1 archaeon SCGC-AAA259D18 TaxID=1698262 RepID=A0A133UBN0_9EURY|nr:transcriptional regulator [candidate division MSBL1 archaeon SCGC-AAA259D18]
MKLIEPKITPPLDENFRPAVLANHTFLDEVKSSGEGVPLKIALERSEGSESVFETEVFSEDFEKSSENFMYVERLVKCLLWIRGGWKITIGGPKNIGEHIKKVYSSDGKRKFDANFMGNLYEKPFTVEVTDYESAPEEQERWEEIDRNIKGCRIGFDLGVSDRKSAAVIDGEPEYTEEIPWDPGEKSDPQYHYDEIMDSLQNAVEHLPRVDCIGGSAAGVYINNRARVASLFRAIPDDLFEEKIKNIFLNLREEWGVPFKVMNDGEVTALAGSMSLDANGVLGIAMGSSEAGGYVTREGNLTEWLNELAFAPVDFHPDASVDEWSGDRGCGARYFSQQAAFRLASKVGIKLDEDMPKTEKLEYIQDLLEERDDEKAKKIFETIGCYLGYGIAHYADFYDLQYVLLLGRVTSGRGGKILMKKAQEVLDKCFPDLAERIELNMPSEKERRVGQAAAAASLPSLND